MPAFVRLTAKPPRRKRKPAAVALAQVTERPTQRTILQWLRAVLPHGSMVSATMNESTPRSKDLGQMARYFERRKASGVVTGWPDLTIVLPGQRVVFVECKRPIGGEVSDAQQSIHRQLIALGFPVVIATSIESTRHGLRAAGIELRESDAEPAAPAKVRLAKPRTAMPADRLPL